jgi:hypothetical protein
VSTQDKADAILTDLAERVRNGAMGIDAALAHAFIAGARYVAVESDVPEADRFGFVEGAK